MRSTLVISTAAALALGMLGSSPADAGSDQPSQQARAPRAAATTLGQAGPGIVVCNTAVPAGVLLTTQGASSASYTATSNGVLTSFTHVANSKAGQVRAIVFGPGSGTQRSVVAKSPKQTVAVSVSNTFAVRLPIKTGQQLGLGYTVSGMACAGIGVPGDVTSASAPFDPDVSGTFTPPGALSPGNLRPNISAVLEPDVDGDGYGDVSQDACPASALSQVACPAPETSITKRPKRFRANPKIKVKFTSSVPGSTFECSLDGDKYRPCASPYKKRLKPRLHKIKIRAVSPVGIVDPKPAKVKVEIKG